MKIVVTHQDAYELDTLLELGNSVVEQLGIGYTITYHTVEWWGLDARQMTHIGVMLEMFGIPYELDVKATA